MSENSMDKKENEEIPVKITEKRWIGKGIYGKTDVPIRILDGFILGVIVAIVVMVFVFALNGKYYIRFDTYGGTEIASQKLEHGQYVKEPEIPVKPGYEFVYWVTSEDETLAEVWDFANDPVEGDTTLYAVWEPAEICVKFDYNGGSDTSGTEEMGVVFGEAYGGLPVPKKEGYEFAGYVYSGQDIEADTIVTATGEHILTAQWIPQENGK
ncbi:MAG: InlB B-repeat-containing protein [Lachnospiraceae bacterium]